MKDEVMNRSEENLPPRGSFDDISDMHPITDVVPPAYWQAPPEWALPVLEAWQGVKLQPKNQGGYDVEFGSCFGSLCASDIEQLSATLGEKLYPIAALAERTGLLLMAPTGLCFTVSVDSNDACSLGTVSEAVRVMLVGGYMRPLLPERDYPQWHNVDVYEPGDNRVHWIKVDDWWADTRAETGSI